MFDINQNLGDKLRIQRANAAMTQDALAEALGLSTQTISTIERGKSFVTSDTLDKMCKLFKVPPKYFFDPVDILMSPYAKRQRQEINDMLDSCTPEQINHIHKIIHILMY